MRDAAWRMRTSTCRSSCARAVQERPQRVRHAADGRALAALRRVARHEPRERHSRLARSSASSSRRAACPPPKALPRSASATALNLSKTTPSRAPAVAPRCAFHHASAAASAAPLTDAGTLRGRADAAAAAAATAHAREGVTVAVATLPLPLPPPPPPPPPSVVTLARPVARSGGRSARVLEAGGRASGADTAGVGRTLRPATASTRGRRRARCPRPAEIWGRWGRSPRGLAALPPRRGGRAVRVATRGACVRGQWTVCRLPLMAAQETRARETRRRPGPPVRAAAAATAAAAAAAAAAAEAVLAATWRIGRLRHVGRRVALVDGSPQARARIAAARCASAGSPAPLSHPRGRGLRRALPCPRGRRSD